MKLVTRQRLLASTLLMGAVAYAGPAFAQEPIESSEDAAEQQISQDSPQPAEIVVTGTRIARPELQASSPVTVIGEEDIRLSGSTNVETFLNELPQATPDATATTNNGTDAGIATINLRDLGPNRTLVLVNGRRMVASNNLGWVDLNNIPAPLIERVDVVTGGASAIYGSDAVAGVVNFIMKDDFQGVEAGGQYRITQKGDAAIWSTDLTLGGNFGDDRGNAVIHASYLERDALLAGERSRTAVALGDFGDSLEPLGSSRIEGGLLLSPAIVPGGTEPTFAAFEPDGTPIEWDGETFNFQPLNFLQTPQKRWLLNGLAHYEINPSMEVYGEAFYANNRLQSQLAADANDIPDLGLLQVTIENPLFNEELQSFLATNFDEDGDGIAEFSGFRRRMSEVGGRFNDFEHNVYRLLGGLRGDLGISNLRYDLYYSHARSNRSEVLTRYTSDIRIQQGLLVEEDPDNPGEFRCADAGARAQGCVPISIFGLGALTPDMISFISPTALVKRDTEQDIASAVISGTPFNLGMGGDDVGLAIGAEYRRESSNNQPDEIVISGELGPGNSEEPTKGKFNVKEVFGEVVVPVVDMVTLEGAVRFSDYSTVGSVWTYKAGGQVEPIQGIRFRGLYQRAVRAPNIFELFQGAAAGADDFDDPCAARNNPGAALQAFCIAQGVPANLLPTFIGDPGGQATTVFGGNPDLSEETADTYTLGVVIEPGSIFRNFAATFDYYNIKVEDAIDDLDAATTSELCFDSLDLTTEACQNIVRDPNSGVVVLITALRSNLAVEEREGFDWQLSYRFDLPGFHPFSSDRTTISLQNVGNYALKNRYQPLEDSEFINCRGIFGTGCTGLGDNTSPKWKTNTVLTFLNGPIAWRNQVRVIGPIRNQDEEDFIQRIDTQAYWDTALSIRPADQFEFTFGIDNVLDKDIIILADSGPDANTDASLYDVFGRTFFVGGRLRF